MMKKCPILVSIFPCPSGTIPPSDVVLTAEHEHPRGTRVSQVPQGPGDFLGIEEVPKKASKASGAGLPIRVSTTKEIPEVLEETLDAVQLEPDDVEEDLDGTVSVALARATIPWEEGANQAKDGTTFIIVGGLAFLPARKDIDGRDEGSAPKVGVVIGHVLPVAVEAEGGPDDGEAHREVGEVVIVDELGIGRGGGAGDREEDGRSKEEDD